ncbi:TPA: hypothetical protein ACW7Y0_001047 [Aeromonas hydrophila]|uniref:hypothetical protein n=1 Tax=Aeromonas caviae TaxID=648 RepID=UPI002B45C913|nr:hypothetical protein [Aeromonas caviae]
MSIALVRRGTLLIPSGATNHLFFVCNDPILYPRNTKASFLAVNISSIAPNIEHDRTCVLDVGDHPFVHHPSFVFYRKAEIFGAATVGEQIAAGDIQTHAICEEPTFARILAGFDLSPHVTPLIRNFYRKYCLTQP